MGKMSDVLSQGGRGLNDPSPDARGLDQAYQEEAPKQPYAGGGGTGGGRVPEGNMSNVSREMKERLVSLYSPHSPQAKRVDILRSQLLYPFMGEPPRIIMIASAGPREGRSLLTANLAISFARGLQQFVMVMDCHLFNPVMHRFLGVPRRPGLTDFLEHGSKVPEIIHWSSVDKLSVIPAGSPSERSAEILATDRMSALIGELRERYNDRYILIDTPPVQMVDDPQVLSRMVEGIIFVVKGGDADRESVLRALERLPNEKILGIVMNDQLSAVSDAASFSGSLGVKG